MSQKPRGYHGGTSISYSIEQALQLMRSLPLEGMNDELIAKVVRTSLESAGVSIPTLLEQANRHQDDITNEIVRLQGEISSLHQAVEEKTTQVTAYQKQLAEISTLRERFGE